MTGNRDITGDMVRLAGEQLVHVVQALTGLLGTIMTIYGRTRAAKPLVKKPFTFQFDWALAKERRRRCVHAGFRSRRLLHAS